MKLTPIQFGQSPHKPGRPSDGPIRAAWSGFNDTTADRDQRLWLKHYYFNSEYERPELTRDFTYEQPSVPK